MLRKVNTSVLKQRIISCSLFAMLSNITLARANTALDETVPCGVRCVFYKYLRIYFPCVGFLWAGQMSLAPGSVCRVHNSIPSSCKSRILCGHARVKL